MRKIIFCAFVCVSLAANCFAQITVPVPTPQQLKWHNTEYYLFAHFGPNTFTDKEWGHGDEPEDIFNPTELDCRQWCRIAKQAGATGIIITAKHHDGFCLWPSKYSKHTVRESKWKNGKGDVLKELSKACKEFGLNFGVYISPWDRNHPDYGTEKYNDVFVNMMKELFTNYGPITELWWDGANGEGPSGKKQVYDWKRFKETVRKLSPTTVVFSDVGPDIRWVGNEKGIAGTTNWNTLNIEGFTPGLGAPSTDTLNIGNKYGKHWIPAECDVSIRPGWFYHAEEDSKVKSPEELFQLYLKSVGRGATLLLNVPPDRRGKFHANDSAALVGFRKLREQSFKTNLLLNTSSYYLQSGILKKVPVLTDGKVATAVTMKVTEIHAAGSELKENKRINCIVLREDLHNGQQCAAFKLLLFDKNDKLIKEIKGSTIGRKRILTFPAIDISTIELTILEQKGATKIAEIEAYLIPEHNIEN
ncbi:glycoside hydrolase family 29 (alpha-L-fucosidase) [Lacibacter luteus]|uniref:alpha-L-fucosidase n=1 Tax=Lacibacter luteus TaxID=2508719 RepID=A0A4Q1CHC5_9BACT|nr:alpha-L-fucosidase [Lacibacter luteus]RXK59316.1 glycoside hydrolase family 29 (alpha-L-fucosidase) [Lacibacter luteus]